MPPIKKRRQGPGRTQGRGGRQDDRRDGRGGGARPGGRGGDRDRPRVFRKKVCRFCAEKVSTANYKDVEILQKFITEKGKIIPRRITGNCSKHQRALAGAVKRSRHSALIAFQID